MKFAELTKRIKLSPSRKTEYFLKYKSFTDKEKLFLEEMIRISYNLGMDDVIQELYSEANESETRIPSEIRTRIENHKRLFPEPEEINLTGLKLKTTKGKKK